MRLSAFWQHLLVFNAFWLLTVKFGNVVAFALLPLYLAWCARRLQMTFSDRWLWLLIAGGLAVDVIAHGLQWIRFSNTPFWLLPLWLAFVLSFPFMYRMLLTQPRWLAFVVGAVMGPMSYWAGQRLGAVVIYIDEMFLLWSVVWAVVFGVLSIRCIAQKPSSGEATDA